MKPDTDLTLMCVECFGGHAKCVEKALHLYAQFSEIYNGASDF